MGAYPHTVCLRTQPVGQRALQAVTPDPAVQRTARCPLTVTAFFDEHTFKKWSAVMTQPIINRKYVLNVIPRRS